MLLGEIFMNKVRYVCNNRNISVEAEELPGIRRVMITIAVNNKPAWQFSFIAPLNQQDKTKDLNAKTALVCRRLEAMSKRDAEDMCEPEKMMICLYAWELLKEVRTKLGTIIWARA
jgi:hypothetical protein